MRIAAILLAAGGGRRYGMPKALARVDGRLLSERALDTLRSAGLAPIVAVIGASADAVRAAVDWGEVTLVENADWATGMGSSLRAGLSALSTSAADAAVILLVDTPGITPAAIVRVAEEAGAGDPTVALLAASYGGRQGHPVLLGRAHWAGVAALAEGDTGARPYLRSHAVELRLIPCDDIADPTDLDTPDPRRS
ncbi:MAG TPA: nucleotidyltransferase family protein [Micromonosporaceae bacterium]|jgi:nicotine blue oxidoreductase